MPTTLDCAAAAHALVAVADGLAVQLLYSVDPAAGATGPVEQALTALDAAVAALLGTRTHGDADGQQSD